MSEDKQNFPILEKVFSSKVADITSKGMVVVAANAFNNEDAAGDISIKGSFAQTIQEDFNRVKWFQNHNRTQLLGVPISAKETDSYLEITAQLNLKKQISQDILADYELYAEHGKTLEHSVMVQAIKRDTLDTRKVLQWKLWEFSTLTNWGCNENTPLLSLKGLTAEQTKEHVELLIKGLDTKNYTAERQQKMDAAITLLKDAINGKLIVKCPCCGLEFNYHSVTEHTLDREILDNLSMYTSWLASDIAYQEVQKLEPSIGEQVLTLIASSKSIEDVATHVRCPKCYSKVYKCDSIIETEEPDMEEKKLDLESIYKNLKKG